MSVKLAALRGSSFSGSVGSVPGGEGGLSFMRQGGSWLDLSLDSVL